MIGGKYMKLPPREKIPEAYTAIIDNRIKMFDNYAEVLSSDRTKTYLIKWNNNLYYSNDNSTYWQGYPGYPVIAILMLQNKLTCNKDILKYFKNINWNELNKKNKRNYKDSLEDIIGKMTEKDLINREIDKVYKEMEQLDIKITRKKNI